MKAGKNLSVFSAYLVSDPFAKGILNASVNWSAWDTIPGTLLFFTLIFSCIFWLKNKIWKGYLVLSLGTAIFVSSGLIFFITKIEGYTQRSPIEFYKSRAGEDCYLHPLYKTYGHLFYGQTQAPANQNHYEQNWLLNGDIDKDTYFVKRTGQAEWIKDLKDIKEIGRKNGFIFYKREKKGKNVKNF